MLTQLVPLCSVAFPRLVDVAAKMAVSAAGFTKAVPYRHPAMPLSTRSPLRSGHLLQREWPGCTVHPALAASALQQHFYVNHMNIVSKANKSKQKQNHCTICSLYRIELKRTRFPDLCSFEVIYFFYIFTTVATKGNPLHWCPINPCPLHQT